MTTSASLRLARFIDRHRIAILGAALLVAVGGGLLARALPVHGDFSYLLPQSASSVVQLRELEKRVTNLGTLMVAVESDDPKARASASELLWTRLEKIDRGLVSFVIFDDRAARQFIWDHRFLYADKADLVAARDALADEIRRAKLKNNPLYVDLEDAPAKDGGTADQLQKRLDEAEVAKDARGRVSKDGRLQLIVVRTTFVAGSASQGKELVTEVSRIAAEVERQLPVKIGLAGDVIVGLAEHDALLSGMLRAALLTVLIVGAGLMFYYRSVRAIAGLMWALAVGTLLTFGVARLTVGHLNLASAFLSSIVVGNGINFGILVVARHLEERRRGARGPEAIAAALGGTVTGTLAAALTAAVAYGSLAATKFRGFRDFGIIGGIGMLLCWIAAYTVLPAALAVLERRGLRVRGKEPALGRLLCRLLPRRDGAVLAIASVALLATAAAGVATWLYLQHPYEENFRKLRSTSPGIEAVQRFQHRLDDTFGRGITGGFAMAAPTRDAARLAAARMRAVDDGKPEMERLFNRVRSIEDALPAEQGEKLAILGDLRRMIDHEANRLDDKDRARLAKLRPPEDLKPLEEADLPDELARPFTTKEGKRGLILFADNGKQFDTWVAQDLFAFTSRVQNLDLPAGVVLGGANFVFADVIRAMEGDGPRATLIALVGALLVIFALLGFGRHAAVVAICMGSGTLLMLAGAWLAGLRVNFLDFVALPITIGIGIDYSVNIVARARQGADEEGGRAALATTGGAVALCSFTTVVGYGSLLLSANQGIRSFGVAAILGEVTCIASALVLAPALLHLLAPRRPGNVVAVTTEPPPTAEEAQRAAK